MGWIEGKTYNFGKLIITVWDGEDVEIKIEDEDKQLSCVFFLDDETERRDFQSIIEILQDALEKASKKYN